MIYNLKKYFLTVAILFTASGCVNRYSGVDDKELNNFKLNEDDVLIVVKVKKSIWTGFYPEESSCPEGLYCIPPCFWFNHEARVLDVLQGGYEKSKIKFSILQHVDNNEEIKKEWYVQLRKFEHSSAIKNLKSEYYVVNHNSDFSICY